MHKSLLVLALLVGCGDDGVHHLPDAPEGIDAAPDAPQSGMVSLTITQDGDPRVNVDVYFLAADNALVAKVKTNSQGVASAAMGLGGSVTAIDPFATKSSGRDLRTFVGVKPGDNLKLHTGGTAAQGTIVNFTLNLPTDAFASTYYVYSDCGYTSFSSGGGGSGSGGGPVSGNVAFSGCGATSDFLIETYDFNGAPIGALYKASVALTEGATVDLTAEAYTTPIPTRRATWSNVPAAYTAVDAGLSLASPKGVLAYIDSAAATVTSGSATATLVHPAVTSGITILASRPAPSNFVGQHTVLDWAPQGTTPIAIDLAGALLATYSTAPSVSAATRSITWSASAGATPDFAWATLSANRLLGQTNTFWSWDIVVPFATTTFTLPVLPTEIADLNFMATDTVNINELLTAKVPGGYDAVRAEILSSSPNDFVAGPSGRIAFETMASQPTVARTAPLLRSWTTRYAHPRK